MMDALHDRVQRKNRGRIFIRETGRLIDLKQCSRYEVLRQGLPPEIREAARPKRRQPRVDVGALLIKAKEELVCDNYM